jgi:hypothetical protein
MSVFETLLSGDTNKAFRDKLNPVIEFVRAAGGNLSLAGPAGRPGPQGPQGPPGDPGTYGVALNGVVDSESQLPAGETGDAYGVARPDGGLDLYVKAPDWKNYGSLTRSAEERNVDYCLYVSPSGDDGKDGRTFGKALRTLDAAQIAATELASSTGSRFIEIFLMPGEYETKGHWDSPPGCSVFGVGGARKTIIRPAPADPDEDYDPALRNVFRGDDGFYLEGVSFENFACNNPGDPTSWAENPLEGFAVAFKPKAVINRAVYAHNIAVYRAFPPRSLISPPMNRKGPNPNPAVGPGGGVAIANGSVVSGYSAFPNIMTWGATPVAPNGIGYYALNGGFINAVNAIALFSHKQFMVGYGSQMMLSACASQFGDYALAADGYKRLILPYKDYDDTKFYPDLAAGFALENRKEQTLDDLVAYILTQSTCGASACCTEDEYAAFARRDWGYFLQAMEYGIKYGDPRPMLQFTRGLWKYDGTFVTSDDCRLLYASWYLHAAKYIKETLLLNTQASAMVDELVSIPVRTLQKPTYRRAYSQLNAIGHNWYYPAAGVTRDALPPEYNNNALPRAIEDSVLETNGGIVNKSGQDQSGNARFVGGLTIENGILGGPPFFAALENAVQQQIFARDY